MKNKFFAALFLLCFSLFSSIAEERYYDPVTGRFISADPEKGQSRVPATLNRYMYANSDPVNNIDPSGRMGIMDTSAATNISITLDSMEANFGTEFASAALDPASFEGALLLDCAAAVAPGVIGKAATMIGKTLVGGKTLTVFAGRYGLAKTLKYFGFVGEAGQQAHHVVSFSSTQPEADLARAILSKHNININSPLNGVWLEKASHNGRHLNAYNSHIYQELADADAQGGAAAVRARLAELRNELANGGLDDLL